MNFYIVIGLLLSLIAVSTASEHSSTHGVLNGKKEENSNQPPLIKIDKTNMVFLRGRVTAQSASKIVNDMLLLKAKEIYFYIDSPGGSVLDGLQIIQAMESIQQSGVKIYTIANNAASMAYIIHQCGTERYVKPWSILMQHQMSLGMQGQYYNLKAYGDLIDKIHNKLLEKQSATARITSGEFNELTRHDMWLLGSESVERGFADKVVNVACDFKPEQTTEVLQTFFGEVTLVYSSCPLSPKPIDIRFSPGMTGDQIKMAKEIIINEYDTDSILKESANQSCKNMNWIELGTN